MATLLSLALLSLFLSSSSAADPPEIQQACKATRDPQTCETSLVQSNHVPAHPTPLQIIQSAVWVSSRDIGKAQSMVQTIIDSFAGNLNRTSAAKNALEVLRNSQYRTSMVVKALSRGKIKDARIWMSASLAYNYDAWSGLTYVNGTRLVDEATTFLNSLIGLTSNALSMIVSYDLYGARTESWGPPKTERDGFWEKGIAPSGDSASKYYGAFPQGLKPDVTVCKSGGAACRFKTVQEGVNAAPDNQTARRFLIRIMAGVYEETVRIPLKKKNVMFLGDGMGKTVITGSLNAGQPGISTYSSATVAVLGDGFMASGITFQNAAGPNAHQAVAFRSDSDLSIIENCEFLGNQDTLYSKSLRQYYKSCRIQGNVDFIFGNSAAVFQDCLLLISPRLVDPEKGEKNAVTAQGRTDPAQSTGFVFQNCTVNGTDDYVAIYHRNPTKHLSYLGRPWKEFSRTVFVGCTLGELVTAEGWMPFRDDFALNTLYYGEINNSGPGANRTGRVPWSSQIPADRVYSYSVQNFIQGHGWIPISP